MKYFFLSFLLITGNLFAQTSASGQISIGTRNTFSFFNDNEGIGKGIGAQFRLRFSERLNSEWFLDYISSKNGDYTARNDHHIGWSLMYYPGNVSSKRLLQPYLLLGHCFDHSKVFAQADKQNTASRLSMATQAGGGTHINITNKLDISLSAQYMLHFGKGISTIINGNEIYIARKFHSDPHGHLLLTLSCNYQIADLW